MRFRTESDPDRGTKSLRVARRTAAAWRRPGTGSRGAIDADPGGTPASRVATPTDREGNAG